MSPLRAVVVTLRPHQWVKNLFVGAPLVFAKRLGDPPSMVNAAAATLSFCALSAAIYALNDVVDAEKDRAHPVKKKRPIASGALSERTALIISALLAIGGLGTAFAINWRFGAAAGGYLVLNLAYSFRLKEIAFVDVAAIAGGFLLRVLGGAFAVDVPASRWLLVCTVLLAAFLGFGKRSHELTQASVSREKDALGRTRKVLTKYKAHHLHRALWILGIATCLAYAAYTQAPHTVEFFGTRHMVWTAPFCVFGIVRFLRIVTRLGHGDSPTEEMLRDKPFILNLTLWALAVLGVIYFL